MKFRIYYKHSFNIPGANTNAWNLHELLRFCQFFSADCTFNGKKELGPPITTNFKGVELITEYRGKEIQASLLTSPKNPPFFCNILLE